MEKIRLDIVGLSYSQTQQGAYTLVLGERKGRRRMPVIIGGPEAQAIAIELEKMKPSRPLTHDLFKNFAETFGIKVSEVIIYNLVEGVFFAKLMCDDGQKIVEIDSRTSDAIALAVRFNAPIFTYEFILASAGITLEEAAAAKESESKTEPAKPQKENIRTMPIPDLENLLKKSIANEDYEKASQIRDEINRRKQS